MLQTLMDLHWINLLFVVTLWLCVVVTALWMIDRLFPRIHRNRRDDHTEGKY